MSRTLMLACIKAARRRGTRILRLKGKRKSFRNISIDIKVITQTYVEYLSYHPCVALRDGKISVITSRFLAWPKSL